MQFTFQLLTRSGRITYDDLRLRDSRFVDAVDRWAMQKANSLLTYHPHAIFAPPPMFTAMRLRNLMLSNRLILSPRLSYSAEDGMPGEGYAEQMSNDMLAGAALVMTEPIAISAGGRITPESAGLYKASHVEAWTRIVESIHTRTSAKLALLLNHAGRRGSTRPRAQGLDWPLSHNNWPLLSASAIPYTLYNQVPKEMDRAEMDHVREDFVRAAQMAREAGFDLLQLHFAHGYLLASFISPLTNQRNDEYGGDLERRMRFPLEVFDAVRAAWPQDKPISVALSASDGVKGGFDIDDAVIVARMLKSHGCDIIAVLAGQTTVDSEPAYGRGFLTPFSERIRNEASIPTMVGGYLTTSNEVNTILAAGRADLCIIDPPHLNGRSNGEDYFYGKQ